MPNYVKTGTDEAGQRVGMLADGTIEVIGGAKPTPLKPTGEITRMNIGLSALERTLDEYDQLIDEFNPRNPLQQMDPDIRSKAEALQARGQLEAKEATALGALTGPDVKILDKVLANPATLKGAYYGQSGTREQIKQARQMVKVRRQAMASMGLPVPPEPIKPGAPPSAIPTAAPAAPGGGKIKFLGFE